MSSRSSSVPGVDPEPIPIPNRNQVRKMETLLYELSLVERSGRTRAEPTELPPDHVQMQHASHGEAERE